MRLCSMNNLILLLLLKRRRLRQQKARTRRLHKIDVRHLPYRHTSGWRGVKEGPGDAGWLALTSLTREAFYILYQAVFPGGEPTPYLKGRPRSMSEEDYLAMALYWLRSRASLTDVAVMFQCPISTLQRHLWRILCLLSDQLPEMELARISLAVDDERIHGVVHAVHLVALATQAGEYGVAQHRAHRRQSQAAQHTSAGVIAAPPQPCPPMNPPPSTP